MKLWQALRSAFAPVAAAAPAPVVRSISSEFRAGRDLDLVPAVRYTAPYEQSTWIFAACGLIAGELSGRPLKFYRGDEEYAQPQLDAWWSAPALGPDGRRLPIEDVVEILTTWDRLEGEFFLLIDDLWLLATGRGSGAALPPFLIARPDRMRHVVRGGRLEGWQWTDAAGIQHTLLPENVVHWRRPNPYDDWRGLGAAQVAKIAAEGDYLAGAYVRNLMRDNGDQGAIIAAKNGCTDEQRKQIAEDLAAKRAALRRGVPKDIFLSADVTVDRPEARAADTAMQSTRLMSRHEVFIALGVPPSFADVKQSYSIGKESDRYQLITSACQPMGSRIAGRFAALASIQAGEVLTCEFDWDNHPVMQEVRTSRLEAADRLWTKGMPLRAVNDYLDLGLEPFPGWERGYLPFSVAPVEGRELPDTSADFAEPLEAPETGADPMASLRTLVAARSLLALGAGPATVPEHPIDRLFGCSCGCEHGTPEMSTVPRAERDPKEVSLWRDMMAKRLASLRSFESAYTRELFKARAETLARLDKLAPIASASVVGRAASGDLVFDLPKWREGFLVRFRRVALEALRTAGQQLFVELGRDDPFAMPPQEVIDYVRASENRLSRTADATWERVRDAIEEGITAGESTKDIAERVRGEFNGIASERALTIAQTETGKAYGAGRSTAMRQAGVQWKKWLTSGNANVRTAHRLANQQIRAIDLPYEVDDEPLMFPGDPKGSPGNVINCHCVSIAVASEKG